MVKNSKSTRLFYKNSSTKFNKTTKRRKTNTKYINMRKDFNEWMASIGNIYYSDNNLMSQAFEKIEDNEEI